MPFGGRYNTFRVRQKLNFSNSLRLLSSCIRIIIRPSDDGIDESIFMPKANPPNSIRLVVSFSLLFRPLIIRRKIFFQRLSFFYSYRGTFCNFMSLINKKK